jgi:hypothetical protein
LRQDIKITNDRAFDYFVLLNRRSALSPKERYLIDSTAKPYISVTVADIPLVSAFEFKTSDGK